MMKENYASKKTLLRVPLTPLYIEGDKLAIILDIKGAINIMMDRNHGSSLHPWLTFVGSY